MKPLNQAAIAVAVATLATVATAQETHSIVSYLNLLDSSANAREAHATSPVDSMAKFGLNAEQQQALLSADRKTMAHSAGIVDVNYRVPQVPNMNDTYED